MYKIIIIRALAVMASTCLSLGVALPADGASATAAGRDAALTSATTCGAWRWPVKTGSDADRHKVSRTVVHTTIRYLRARTAPSSFVGHQDRRFQGAERHTYQLTARLTQFRLEDDGDIHLVLKDSAGRDMIAEIPMPGCVAASSLWKRAIRSVRLAFTSRYHVTTSWHHVSKWIRIRGLGFFDEIHNVTGQAPNGIELHPVIHVRF